MIEAPLQIVPLGEGVLSEAAGVGLIDTTTGSDMYSHPPGAAVVIPTVTESPSFNTPAAGVQFSVATPTGLPSTYHAIVSPGTLFPTVKVIVSESHIVLSASLVVMVGLSLLSTTISILTAAPPTVEGTPAAQSTPF